MVVSKLFYFHPYFGKLSNLTHIFQMGWFNHQLGNLSCSFFPDLSKTSTSIRNAIKTWSGFCETPFPRAEKRTTIHSASSASCMAEYISKGLGSRKMKIPQTSMGLGPGLKFPIGISEFFFFLAGAWNLESLTHICCKHHDDRGG